MEEVRQEAEAHSIAIQDESGSALTFASRNEIVFCAVVCNDRDSSRADLSWLDNAARRELMSSYEGWAP